MRKALVVGGTMLAASLWFQQPAASQQPQAARPLVLRGATTIDVVAGRPIEDSVIVIEGDRVRAVGDKNTRYPTSAEVIDLPGKFIIPGLVEAHFHYQTFTGELALNHGITSGVIPNARGEYSDEYWSRSQLAGVRTPRLFGGGRRPLGLTESMTRDQVREAVRRYVADGAMIGSAFQYPAANVHNPARRQVYQWAAEAFHDEGLILFGHTDDAEASVRAGQDAVEHPWGYTQSLMSPEELDGYLKGKYLHWGQFWKPGPRMDAMIRESVERGVYLNPTLVYEHGESSALTPQYERLAYELYRNPALMTYYPSNLAHGLLQKYRMAKNFSTRYPQYVPLAQLPPDEVQVMVNAYRGTGDFVRRWVQAGGKIMGGTDDPVVGTLGLSIHMEMGMLVESGLTPLQALRSFTQWSAETLTVRRKPPVKQEIGVLDEGAFADLVVLGANPLTNIDNTRRIERVMKGGQFVRLGYTHDYTTPPPPEFASTVLGRAISHTPEPEISAITPSSVVEGGGALDMTVEGVGFVQGSVVRVNGEVVPTEFVDIRTLKAKIPAAMVARAVPNRFVEPGPGILPGVFGDRTLQITVFNYPPDGGASNPVSLRVKARWMSQ